MIKNQIWFAKIKDIPQGPLKDMLVKRGDRAVLYAPMNDLDENLIGMLEIEWLSENDVPVITEPIKNSIKTNATLISGYFSLTELKDSAH